MYMSLLRSTYIVILFQFSVFKFLGNELLFETVDFRNGLSSNRVSNIFLDNEGFLWFCTYNDLNRYDGYDIDIFKPQFNIDNSTKSSNFNTICQDLSGNFWIGSTNNGICIMDKSGKSIGIINNDTFNELYISSNTINDILCDSKGRIWIATGFGLNMYVPESNKMFFNRLDTKEKYKNYPDIYITRLFEDSKGRIWIGTWDYGLFMYDENEDSFYQYFLDGKVVDKKKLNRVYSIFEDSKGYLWFGTWDAGLFKVEVNNDTIFSILDHFYYQAGKSNPLISNIIYDIEEDVYGRLWIGTPNGLGIVDFSSEIPKHIHYKEGINNKTISHIEICDIQIDSSGIMWLATDGGGVNKVDLNRKVFTTYKLNDQGKGSLGSYIYSFIVDDQSRLLVGARSNGFGSFDLQTQKFTHYKNVSPYNLLPGGINSIISFYKDSRGNLWIGTRYDHMYQINPGGDLVLKFCNNYNIASISSITEDVYGTIWAGSTKGLYEIIYDKATGGYIEYNYSENNGDSSLYSRYIYTIWCDSKNQLWVGTRGKKMQKLDLNKRKKGEAKFEAFSLISTDNNIEYPYFNNIFEDSKGRFWACIEGYCIAQFDEKKNKIIHSFYCSEIRSDEIYNVVEDDYGFLWLSGNKGLTRLKYIDEKNYWVKNFNIEDGLQSNIFNRNASFKFKNGNIFFGGPNGFNIIEPDSAVKNTYIPSVVLTSIKVMGSPVNINYKNGELLHLSPKEKRFSVKFSALSFSQSDKNKYQYMLAGYDRNWNVSSSDKREISYSDIPPGNYTFKVKASNNDGIWSNKETTLNIFIKPPIWLTSWFLVLSVIFSMLIFAAIFLIRNAAIRRENKELSKRVEDRTKELESKNEILKTQASSLNETNTRLEERQQHIEEQLEQITAQKLKLDHVNENLIESNAMKDKFFSIIGHDLKSPLNRIIGFTDMLQQGNDKLEVKNKKIFINSIVLSAKKTFKLLENSLDWSRLNSGKIKFSPGKIMLNQIIRNSIVMQKSLLRNKKIDIENRVDSEIAVFTDFYMLDAILRNLINNAIKFSYQGGRIIISSKYSEDQKYVVVSIKDNGTGITNEFADNLFKIDKSTSTPGTQNETGTGLGLILCKEFVEKNKGKIWLDNRSGRGTTISFSLQNANNNDNRIE